MISLVISDYIFNLILTISIDIMFKDEYLNCEDILSFYEPSLANFWNGSHAITLQRCWLFNGKLGHNFADFSLCLLLYVHLRGI